MKKLQLIFPALQMIFLLSTTSVSAQDTKKQKQVEKEAAVKSLVDGQHYSFEAQIALPPGRSLKSEKIQLKHIFPTLGEPTLPQ